jgi:hypothetical protein
VTIVPADLMRVGLCRRVPLAGRWAAAGVLTVVVVNGAGASWADAGPGCPDLEGAAAQYVDEAKLCANMQEQVRNWLQGGRLDIGRAVGESVRRTTPQTIPEQHQPAAERFREGAADAGTAHSPQEVKPSPELPQPKSSPPTKVVAPETRVTRPPTAPGNQNRPDPRRREPEATEKNAAVIPVLNSPRPTRVSLPDRKTVPENTRDAGRPLERKHPLGQVPPKARPQDAVQATPDTATAPQPLHAQEASFSTGWPLTIPAALVVGLLLAVSYRRRRQLVGNVKVWWRRTRVTRDADRLFRYSARTHQPAVAVREQKQTASPENPPLLGAPEHIPPDGQMTGRRQETTAPPQPAGAWMSEVPPEPTGARGGHREGDRLVARTQDEEPVDVDVQQRNEERRDLSEGDMAPAQLSLSSQDPARDRGETREGAAFPKDDAERAQESSNLSYAVALSALCGMGLTGPGADDVARAMVVELLTVRDMTARVLMPRQDAVRLFGRYVADLEIPGLVVLDSLQDVVTELEVEIIRRSGQRTDSGVPEGLSWLFVVTSVGAAGERLHHIVDGGAEDLILGAFLDPWPYGITCEIDESGLIISLEGQAAPQWAGRRLVCCDEAEAARSLVKLTASA